MKDILIIEDSDEDFEVLEYALQKNDFLGNIIRFKTGDEAIDALSGNEANHNYWMILLDLNLPGLNGLEVLKHFKQAPNLKKIPIIIISTSRDPSDVKQSYDLYANSYIQKPVDFNGFIKLVGKILYYWDNVSISPSKIC